MGKRNGGPNGEDKQKTEKIEGEKIWMREGVVEDTRIR